MGSDMVSQISVADQWRAQLSVVMERNNVTDKRGVAITADITYWCLVNQAKYILGLTSQASR
jgi:hypothetical protein